MVILLHTEDRFITYKVPFVTRLIVIYAYRGFLHDNQ
jgi:hypothetical protein